MNKRPIGISILSVLFMIGGIAGAAISLLAVAMFDRLSEALSAINVPPALVVVTLLLVALLALVAAIGMWRGSKWGWWLGVFSYAYGVARAVGGLLVLSSLGSIVDGEDGPTDADYYKWGAKFATRLVVCSLLFCYFFKSNVLAYFGLQQLKKAKAVGILIAATLGLVVLINGAAWFAR